jgi:hypothetical protein
MWSGFEPAEGQINETYVDIIAEIVDGLASRGIYAYLDMHQARITLKDFTEVKNFVPKMFRKCSNRISGSIVLLMHSTINVLFNNYLYSILFFLTILFLYYR